MATTVDNWKDFGFSSLQKLLDEQSSKINDAQEEGAASRKALSAKTKAFRKLTDDEKLAEIRGLLKGYQSEIDSLTTRCKYAESCFMNVYKSMALLPDPEPLLAAKQSEIDKLKAESANNNSSEQDSALARELERQTMRVSQLEKQLRAKNAGAGASAGASADAKSIGAKGETGNDALKSRVEELETQLMANQAQIAQKENALKEQTTALEKQQQELQTALNQLATQKDYDLIKQKLISELQSSSKLDLDNNNNDDDDKESIARRRQIKQLEQENQQLKEQYKSTQSEQARLRSLVGKLEEDLSSMQQSHDTFSTISGWTAVPKGGGPGSTLGGPGSISSSGGTAVSKIIVQQRDRYKQRMQELEEKNHATETALAQTKRDLETLKRESHMLYERIRQLQASSTSSGGGEMPIPVSKSLYEPLAEQQLKDLDLERRTMGVSTLNAKLIEFSARCMVDQRYRYGVSGYAVIIHLLALYGIFV